MLRKKVCWVLDVDIRVQSGVAVRSTFMRDTSNQRKSVADRSTPARTLAACALPLLVASVVVLAGCGGGGTVPDSEPTATDAEQQAAAAAAAEAQRQLEARRAQLDEAQGELARLRREAETAIPLDDEQLDELLADLQVAVSRAQGDPEGEDAGQLLQHVENLERQASARLNELKAQEQEARSEIREMYAEVVEASEPVAAELLRGLDGELYLGYRTEAVEKVQREVQQEGYYDGPITGELDQATRVALGRFQQLHGQVVTGIPTPYTRFLLENPDESD